MRKNFKDLFEAFLNKFSLKLEEYLFLYNFTPNLAAAEELEIKGTSFEKAEKIWKILEQK